MFEYNNKSSYHQGLLIYRQGLSKALECKGQSICCGRLTGQVMAYRQNGKLCVEYYVHDEDDYYLSGSIQCCSEEQFRRTFHEIVNIYMDYKYYKIWNVLSFFKVITVEIENVLDKDQCITGDL